MAVSLSGAGCGRRRPNAQAKVLTNYILLESDAVPLGIVSTEGATRRRVSAANLSGSRTTGFPATAVAIMEGARLCLRLPPPRSRCLPPARSR